MAPGSPVALGKWKYPALSLTMGVICLILLVPVAVLAAWSLQALLSPEILQSVFRSGSRGFGSYTWNSLWTSALAAFLAVLLTLPAAYLASRYPNRIARSLSRICQVGYAIPGVVIALSLLFISTPILLLADAAAGGDSLCVQAYAAGGAPSSAGAGIGHAGEVGRMLGRTARQTFKGHPLALPGILAGAALVFLTSLKELPAMLLLRPAGFDTLAVRA
jgi:iron(III) transport system permease protein